MIISKRKPLHLAYDTGGNGAGLEESMLLFLAEMHRELDKANGVDRILKTRAMKNVNNLISQTYLDLQHQKADVGRAIISEADRTDEFRRLESAFCVLVQEVYGGVVCENSGFYTLVEKLP
jgi:hypothetical protein